MLGAVDPSGPAASSRPARRAPLAVQTEHLAETPLHVPSLTGGASGSDGAGGDLTVEALMASLRGAEDGAEVAVKGAARKQLEKLSRIATPGKGMVTAPLPAVVR